MECKYFWFASIIINSLIMLFTLHSFNWYADFIFIKYLLLSFTTFDFWKEKKTSSFAWKNVSIVESFKSNVRDHTNVCFVLVFFFPICVLLLLLYFFWRKREIFDSKKFLLYSGNNKELFFMPCYSIKWNWWKCLNNFKKWQLYINFSPSLSFLEEKTQKLFCAKVIQVNVLWLIHTFHKKLQLCHHINR